MILSLCLVLAAAPAKGAPWVESFEALRPARPKFDLEEIERLAALAALKPSRLEATAAKRTPLERYRLARRLFLLEAVAVGLRPAFDALAGSRFEGAAAAKLPHLAPFFRPAGEGEDPLIAWASRLSAAGRVLDTSLRRGLSDAERRELVAAKEFLLPPPLPVDGPIAQARATQQLDSLIDAALGVRYQQTEAELPRGAEGKELYGEHHTYIEERLPDHALQTPYHDLWRALEALELKPGEKVVDLGSGYGRVCFFVALTRPEVECAGYEIVPERVLEAKRVAAALGFSKLTFEARDLTDPGFSPAPAGAYFAYDPVNYKVVGKVLGDLQAIARTRPLRLVAVEGRGGFHPLLAKQPWLKKVGSFPTVRWVSLPPVLVFESVAPPQPPAR